MSVMVTKGKACARETRGRRNASNPDAKGTSTLINRNVSLDGRRTSFRFEQGMWDALDEICHREAVGLGTLFEQLDQRRRESSLTAAIRVYILSYYRSATTEVGHAAAHSDQGVLPHAFLRPFESFGRCPVRTDENGLLWINGLQLAGLVEPGLVH